MTEFLRRYLRWCVPLLATLATASGCNPAHSDAPELLTIAPSEVTTLASTLAELGGRNLFATASADLDTDEPPDVNREFAVAIGDVRLAAASITFVDPQEIEIVVPAGLSPGPHDVTVTTPGGRDATLEDGLLVRDDAALVISIEDAPGGAGAAVEDVLLLVDQTRDLHLVGRRSGSGEYLFDVDASWEIEGASGNLTEVDASHSVFTATALGTAEVTARSALYGEDSTGTISVVACILDGGCADPCRSTNECVDNACVVGAVDKDDDEDGHLDGVCPGGDDCDDDDGENYPGNPTPAIGNGVDNDCDGLFLDECYLDGDGDGHGTDAGTIVQDLAGNGCLGADNESTSADDCDDAAIANFPGNPAPAIGNGVDNDCDGLLLDECYLDGDGDGHGTDAGTIVQDLAGNGCLGADNESTSADDCDDAAIANFPGNPTPAIGNGVDNDCDGLFLDECYLDGDGDGYGSNPGVLVQDAAGNGCLGADNESTTDDDCDDADGSVYPGTTCDDGDPCTALDICNAATCAGTPATCEPGMAVWCTVTASSTTPRYNLWDGAAFIGTDVTDTVGEWRYMTGATASTRPEAIVVGVTVGQQITGEMWDGFGWTELPFSPIANVGWDYYRDFHVAYEQSSGDALVIWANGTLGTDHLSYRVWDGTDWTDPAGTITALVSGQPRQVYGASNPLSDEIVLVVNTSAANYAVVWDGDSWGSAEELTDAPSDTDLNVAYEQNTGRAIAVYGKDGSSLGWYRVWNGLTWELEDPLGIPPPVGEAERTRWFAVGADPNSDRIAVGVSTYAAGGDAHIWLTMWDGSSWEAAINLTSAHSSNLNYINIPVAFERLSGQALAAYKPNATEDRVHYLIWTPGVGWVAQPPGPSLGANANTMVMAPDPFSDAIMLSAQDEDSDLSFLLWDGSSWGAPDKLDLDTGEDKNQPFVFLWGKQ